MLPPTFSRLVPVLCKSGEVSPTRSIMVRYYKFQKDGSGCATVIFVPAFLSNGLGLKSQLLAEVCSAKGYNFVSYCPEGFGESPGDPMTYQLSDWFEDCQTALDIAKTEEPEAKVILVGSSMGCWIGLQMALDNKDLIKGLVLISPAINHLWSFYVNWFNQCDEDSQKKLEAGEAVLCQTNDYGERLVRKDFAVKTRDLELDQTKPIDVDCPVRILHVVEDEVIPFEKSMKLMELLTSDDVDIVYRKKGQHKFVARADLDLIGQTVDSLAQQLLSS